jgi:UDP-glucose 4,6-dehydratase
VVILLAQKYPNYKIVNFDKLVSIFGRIFCRFARAALARVWGRFLTSPSPPPPSPPPFSLTAQDYCSSLKNLVSVQDLPNYTFVKGSITSPDLVNYVLRKEHIDTIMHFAAQTHVDNSFGNSFSFTEANILGTHVLLEAAKEARVKLFLHVSTDEVYGDGETGVPSHEGSPLEPTNPYAATKAGAEYLVKSYHRSFALPTIITRGNNVYGPHQFPEKIIPKFVNQLMRGLPLTLHGTGANTRNYLFVEDVARAFDVVLHKGSVGEIYNIGGNNEKSNIEVARELLKSLGKVAAAGSLEAAEAKHIVLVPDRPFNDLRYHLDCARLNALGWKEEVSFEAGLARTVEWYAKFSGNWDNVESALVAHPRRGFSGKAWTGKPDEEASAGGGGSGGGGGGH